MVAKAQGEDDAPETLDAVVEHRAAFLREYQDEAWAQRYRRFVERVRAGEAERAPGRSGLAEAVARNLFRLMSYKDEYEVARLYTNGESRPGSGASSRATSGSASTSRRRSLRGATPRPASFASARSGRGCTARSG